jgi:hypoxanthine phosphoribosyltransferase
MSGHIIYIYLLRPFHFRRAFLLQKMIQIKDKQFISYISEEMLLQRVREMGGKISRDFKDQSPLILGVLNGSFMFLADLAKSISIPVEINFLKISSYQGTSSTGQIKEKSILNVELKGRCVIIVEDIVDTGLSMAYLVEKIKKLEPKSISIATLLTKPDALQHPVKVDYVGFEIPNKFVVGYGLDYEGYGRNLPAIYQLK